MALAIVSAVAAALAATDPPLDADSYNQWKDALRTKTATPAGEVRSLDGFSVELVRSAAADEGSWVAMAFDRRGRLIISREDRGLLRLTPDNGGFASVPIEKINDTLAEVRGIVFAGNDLFANANNSRALVRLRDTDGDDKYDEVKTLRETPGGVGHGRNQLALGPDGFLYSIHGDDVQPPADGAAPRSPLRHTREDRLLPFAWDKFSWSDSVRPPCGHLVRTDLDGKEWTIIAGGMRNPFGIAFNPDGELFTYDADMEWDVGLPWYRPTRVLHLVSGADYGWRGANRAQPAWTPGTLPAAVDIGKGSPTAVMFGTKSRFPEPWRSALFILDWAYGKIYAVHLDPRGATYAGRADVFVQGRPLNVTGLDFAPDGAMFFITGGRRTQSGLYRVRWTGGAPESPPAASTTSDAPAAAAARELRNQLEHFHRGPDPRAIEVAWPHLDNSDLWIRHAARVAIEAQPIETWQEKAWAESRPLAAAEALLAVARAGTRASQDPLVERACRWLEQSLPNDAALTLLRALEVTFAREGRPADPISLELSRVLAARYPAKRAHENQLICELLVFLRDAGVVAKTISLLDQSASREEQLPLPRDAAGGPLRVDARVPPRVVQGRSAASDRSHRHSRIAEHTRLRDRRSHRATRRQRTRRSRSDH